MNRNNKKMTTSFIILSLFLIGLVYAILQADLQINGTAKIQANTWDIHFDNIQVNSNSVAIGTGDSAATIDSENNCKVDFEVTLSIPGDFYEFTIDVVNAGTIDGMIGELNKTLKVNNEVVSEIPDYLNYSVTYADGDEIIENHKLDAGSIETYKVRLEFKTDIEELPQATTITTSLEPQYLQADSSSVYRADADFATSSWDEIVKTYKIGNLSKLEQAMKNGVTREVPLDLDFDGMYETITHVRIANLSKPAECLTSGFSQTACGFVIEFADIITKHNMNSTDTNVGGWPASSMRTYVNTDIYNALPTELKSIIIDTTVVSGHGSTSGETNFTSTDKIYLISTKELWGKEGTSNTISKDSSETETRQLDYYSYNNVTTSNYSGAVKRNLSGSADIWWLRSAFSNDSSKFFRVYYNGDWNREPVGNMFGVSPTFRIAE